MINSVAVLGAGVMGAQIAAHFANAGVPALLLDMTAEAAEQGLKRARGLKPDPFFTPDTYKLIATDSFDAGLARLKDADWILEAIVEQLDVKRALMARVDAARRPGSIVSSNTSAISIASIADGCSDDFRRHFLGTHFFNPPRYLHLLEVIPDAGHRPRRAGRGDRRSPTARSARASSWRKTRPASSAITWRCTASPGSSPASRSGQYTIEEIDEITGPAIGRPKSATFRTLDLAGIDILGHVIRDLHQRLPDPAAQAAFTIPAFIEQMLAKGLVGEKAGQGFYKRVKGAGGESEILTIDRTTLEYAPKKPARLPSLESARAINDVGERIKTLFNGNDRVGQFLRETLAPTLVYSAQATPAIAYSAEDVDRVMRWGFGWDLGPVRDRRCDRDRTRPRGRPRGQPGPARRRRS